MDSIENIISINADGIAEGVAIGVDKFLGSVFIDNLLKMEKKPDVKYMILLGEVGVLPTICRVTKIHRSKTL